MVSSASVFISYSRADRARVAPLAAALDQRGCNVWWDAHIEGGSAFAERIEENLARSDVVLVVWSATSVMSDWVRDEAGHGRDRKRLVPVTFDGTLPPIGFRQYHVVDLAGWRGDAAGLDAVMRGIAVTAGGSADPRAPGDAAGGCSGPGTSRRSGLTRRHALAVGGAGALATAGGLGWWVTHPGSTLPNTIAVMPLRNISGDAGQDYFAQGLTEEVRTALAQIPDLQIAAPGSVGQLRDQQADMRTIGSKLGVAYVLGGSVRRAGNVARIAVELTETASGFSRWTQSFDRALTDVFAVQTEIARVITEALALRVKLPDAAQGGTGNVAAYDAYLRGVALFTSDRGEASDRAALAQFRKAMDADGRFALARAYAAFVMTTIAAAYAAPAEMRLLYPEALGLARAAAAQAPGVPLVELALGHATMYGGRRVGEADAAYAKAYALGGGDTRVAIPYALFCSYLGKTEAAASAAARVVRLDPVNAASFRMAGLVRYFAQQPDEAAAMFRKALELNPDIRNAHGYLGLIALRRGDRAAARREFGNEAQDLIAAPGQAILARQEGDPAAAAAHLQALVDKYGDNSLFQQAQVYAQWGETERALAALEQAQRAGDRGLLGMKVHPLLDPVRGAPRFSALLRQMGLA